MSLVRGTFDFSVYIRWSRWIRTLKGQTAARLQVQSKQTQTPAPFHHPTSNNWLVLVVSRRSFLPLRSDFLRKTEKTRSARSATSPDLSPSRSLVLECRGRPAGGLTVKIQLCRMSCPFLFAGKRKPRSSGRYRSGTENPA